MKIVARAAFLALPPGIVYARWGEPGSRNVFVFGDLEIKDDTSAETTWFYQRLIPWPADCHDSGDWIDRMTAMQDQGADSGPLDFDTLDKDSHYEAGQLFAVFEKADVDALIARLQRALTEGYR